MGYTYPGQYVYLGFNRGWLDRPAAESQWRIDHALGHPQQITEAGRFWAEQQAHYARYLAYLKGGAWAPIALSPDTPSLHQKGNAKDTNERPNALLNEHGWYLTVYRWVNGVWTLIEPWHYEYFIDRDKHRHEGIPLGTYGNPFPLEDIPAKEEEDDMSWKPALFARGTSTFDGSLIHPDFGAHLKEGEEERDEFEVGGKKYVVITKPGILITNHKDTWIRWQLTFYPGQAWSKFEAQGSETDKAAIYIGVQNEATRVALELRNDPKA